MFCLKATACPRSEKKVLLPKLPIGGSFSHKGRGGRERSFFLFLCVCLAVFLSQARSLNFPLAWLATSWFNLIPSSLLTVMYSLPYFVRIRDRQQTCLVSYALFDDGQELQ